MCGLFYRKKVGFMCLVLSFEMASCGSKIRFTMSLSRPSQPFFTVALLFWVRLSCREMLNGDDSSNPSMVVAVMIFLLIEIRVSILLHQFLHWDCGYYCLFRDEDVESVAHLNLATY